MELSQNSKTPKLHYSVVCSLFGNFLSFGLRGCGCGRGGFGLHHAHFLFIFLEERRAAHLTRLLLAGDARAHFLSEVQSGPHLTLAGSGGLAQLLHGLAQFSAPMPCNSLMELF